MAKKSTKKSTGKRRSTSKRSTTSRKKKSIAKKTKVSKVKSKTTKKSKVSKVKSKTTKNPKTKTSTNDLLLTTEILESASAEQRKVLAEYLKTNVGVVSKGARTKPTTSGSELPDSGPTEKGEKLTEPPAIPLPVLRILVEMYYDFQNTRIRTGNRAAMNLERNGIGKEALAEYGVDGLFDTSKKFERDIVKLITQDLKRRPIYTDFLEKLYGISAIIGAGLIAWIQDPSNYDNISKLHQNAGLGHNRYCDECGIWLYEEILIPKTGVDGKISNTKAKRLTGKKKMCNKCGNDEHVSFYPQRKAQGYQVNHNPKLKTHMWKVGGSFVLQKASKSIYRALYNQERAKLDKRFPAAEQIEVMGKKRLQHNPKHNFEAAKRKVEKIFLGHLWLVWRIMNGNSITPPYMPKGDPPSNHRIMPPVVDIGELPELVKTELLKLHSQYGVYPSDLNPDWIDRTNIVKKDDEATLEENATPPSDAPEGTSLPDVDVDIDDDETN